MVRHFFRRVREQNGKKYLVVVFMCVGEFVVIAVFFCLHLKRKLHTYSLTNKRDYAINSFFICYIVVVFLCILGFF